MALSKSGRGKGQWLKAEVDGGKLVISVGIDVLAFAAQRRLDDAAFNESGGENMQSEYEVVDPAEFAKAIANEVMREEENGDNRVHLMLDKAFDYAIEQGCFGVAEREVAEVLK